MPRDKMHRYSYTEMRGRAQDLSPVDRYVAQASWPVGAVYISTVATNPSSLLGFGSWELYAKGRVLVGIDTSQPEFDTLGETGGENLHTLTCPEVPVCP